MKLAFPLIDELLECVEKCFSGLHKQAIQGLHLTPALFVRAPEASRSAIIEFTEAYKDYLPQCHSVSLLTAELDIWETILKAIPQEDLPETAADALLLACQYLCPTIDRLL